MPISSAAFVLADGAVDVAIGIAVLVISFIGWIIQLVGKLKTNSPPPARPLKPPVQRPPMASPKDERLQSEIDSFLRQVATNRNDRQLTEADIEIVEDDDDATEQSNVKRGTAASSRSLQQVSHARTGSTLSQHHLGTTPLGAELRRHADTYLPDSHQGQAYASLPPSRTASAVDQPGSSASGGSSTARPTGSSRFTSLLRNQRSVKDSIVINEVLGRPKGLARRR